MILLNENNQKYTLFNLSTHFCKWATVQSGHLKSPARTRVNLCKIIFPKNKATIINLMTVVIQYANAYSNLKNQDFWCGHLRTDQDCWCCLRTGRIASIVAGTHHGHSEYNGCDGHQPHQPPSSWS